MSSGAHTSPGKDLACQIRVNSPNYVCCCSQYAYHIKVNFLSCMVPLSAGSNLTSYVISCYAACQTTNLDSVVSPSGLNGQTCIFHDATSACTNINLETDNNIKLYSYYITLLSVSMYFILYIYIKKVFN